MSSLPRPLDEPSVSYVQRGASYGQRAGNTGIARLPATRLAPGDSSANADAAREAIERAERAWTHVRQ